MEKDTNIIDNNSITENKNIENTQIDTNNNTNQSENNINTEIINESKNIQKNNMTEQKNESRNPSSNKFAWLLYIPIIGLFTYFIRQTTDIFHIITIIIVLFFTIYIIHTNFFKPYNSVEDDVNSNDLIEGHI